MSDLALNLPENLPNNWQVFENPEVLAEATVARILQLAEQAIRDRGEFHLVTAGGTTPNRCYQMLAELKDSAEIDWQNWFIYLGDERVLPADDKERNSLSLNQIWLEQVAIPAENIFFMPTELGLQPAVAAYEKIVKEVAKFDLVLLGMGEDGHTASLFPGHDTINSKDLVLAETNSPKPPAERVSLGKVCLENTREMIKLITGTSKQEAIADWLAGKQLPINQVAAANCKVFISAEAI